MVFGNQQPSIFPFTFEDKCGLVPDCRISCECDTEDIDNWDGVKHSNTGDTGWGVCCGMVENAAI